MNRHETVRLTFFMLLALLLVRLIPAAAQSETLVGITVATDTGEGIGIYSFNEAVPNNWLAPPDGSPRYQIEIIPSATSSGTCGYTVRDLNGRVIRDVNVVREVVDAQVTITDLLTNNPIGNATFLGRSGCPYSISCSSDQGNVSCGRALAMPDTAEFATWLTVTMTGLPDLEASRPSDIAMVFTEQNDLIDGASYDPDGRFVLTFSNHQVWIWNAVTGEKERQVANGALLSGANFSPDGRFILTNTGGGLGTTIWDASTGEQLRALMTAGSNEYVETVAYSPDGRFIVAGIDNGARIWNASTGDVVRQLAGHTSMVMAANYSPDGQFIITASFDQTARIWNATTGEVVHQLVGHTGPVKDANYSPDGQFVVTASYDHAAWIWNAVTGEVVRQLMGHTDDVTGTSYSPDGRFIVTTSDDNTMRIWDASSGEEIRTLSNHGYELSGASYSPDGRFILASSSDGTAIIWDVSDLLNAS